MSDRVDRVADAESGAKVLGGRDVELGGRTGQCLYIARLYTSLGDRLYMRCVGVEGASTLLLPQQKQRVEIACWTRVSVCRGAWLRNVHEPKFQQRGPRAKPTDDAQVTGSPLQLTVR